MAFGAKVKLTIDKSGKAQFKKEIQEFVDQATKGGIKLTNFTVKLKAADRKVLLQSVESELAKSPIKISKVDASGAIKSLKAQLTTMLSGLQIGGLGAFLGTDGTEATYQKAVDAAKRAGEATNAAAREAKNLQTLLDAAYKTIMGMPTNDKLDEMLQQYRELAKAIEHAKTLEGEARAEAIVKIQQGVTELNRQIEAQKEAEKQAKKSAAAVKDEAEEERKRAAEAERAYKKEVALHKRNESLQKRILTYMKQNTKAVDVYGEELEKLLAMLSGSGAYDPKLLDKVELGFLDIQVAAKKAHLEGDSLFKKLQGSWEQIGGLAVLTGGMHKLMNALKKMVPVVKELDSAMTELRKVTDLTDAAYDHFYNRAIDISGRIGSKISDTINATADFARLGYDVEDAANMAEAALVYKNVGDGIEDVSVASESLISTIKAFGEETYSAMQIVDMFNEVGKFCPAA